MSTELLEYVRRHTERGECKCGRCFDAGGKPDPRGHTADLIFFKATIVPPSIAGEPSAETFKILTAAHRSEFAACDPLDGNQHGHIELGAWLGDQGVALQYMALGHLLGVFDLLTPFTMLPGIGEDQAMEMATKGYVNIIKVAA